MRKRLRLKEAFCWDDLNVMQPKAHFRKPDRRDAEPRPPIVQASASAALTLALMGGLVWHLIHSQSLVRDFQDHDIAIERVTAEIVYYDEALTMSAMMAAATGDIAWEDRYLAFVNRLDKALLISAELEPENGDARHQARVEAANQRLIELETEAFALVEAGQSKTAFSLLSGDEYTEQKRIYSKNAIDRLHAMRANVSSRLVVESVQLRLGLACLVPAMIVLFLTWLSAIRAFRGHLVILEETRRRADQAAEEALSASRAKSDFLTTMSHEIRTPMNGIVGAIDLLEASSLDSSQRDVTRIALSSANSLLCIINDILDISKVEAGKIELDPTPTDLGLVLRDVFELVNATAEKDDVSLSIEHCGVLPLHVLVDAGRIRQVILNLMGNAVKFSPGGSVQLRTVATDIGASGLRLRVEVIDDGIGISPEAQSKIFARFSQADESTTRRFGGTGLGLAISEQLVRLMDGEIGVESALGDGSTFWMELTLPKTVLETVAIEPESAGDEALVGSARVLVVDDNRINRVLADRMLRRLGCEVDLAEDGAEALEQVQKTEFDLVLMDCQMPVMDGLTATRKIRSLGGRYASLPIVAVTADVVGDNQDRCVEAGMSDFVAKPLKLDRLRSVINRWG